MITKQERGNSVGEAITQLAEKISIKFLLEFNLFGKKVDQKNSC